MELNQDDVAEFVLIKSKEMAVDFPLGENTIEKTWRASGGLPLALQWMIGYYKLVRDIGRVTAAVVDKDSPVLEFSFRNMWNVLSPDSRSFFGSPKVHVGHFASLTLGGGSSMLVSQSMITPMSADAEWRQSLRIRPPAFRLENHACAP